MAKRNGADWTINNGQTSLAECLQDKGIKPTLIIDAVPPVNFSGGSDAGLSGGQNCAHGILN